MTKFVRSLTQLMTVIFLGMSLNFSAHAADTSLQPSAEHYDRIVRVTAHVEDGRIQQELAWDTNLCGKPWLDHGIAKTFQIETESGKYLTLTLAKAGAVCGKLQEVVSSTPANPQQVCHKIFLRNGLLMCFIGGSRPTLITPDNFAAN